MDPLSPPSSPSFSPPPQTLPETRQGEPASLPSPDLSSVQPSVHPSLQSSLTPEQQLARCTLNNEATLPLLNPLQKKREVVKLILPNGLKVMLVHLPQLKESAAALAVHAGSHNDPEENQGIAHFTEHLLFMGTQKYPKESEYSAFISANGGMSNAYTDSDRTVYSFSCAHKGLLGALDRFAWFFRAPLFEPSGVEREINAIHNEFSKCQDSDSWRTFHVLKELALPDHPGRYFNCGNRDSMKRIAPESVREWYEKHYSANLMTLAIYTALPTETVAKEILRSFAPIPSQGGVSPALPGPLYDPQYFGHQIFIPPKAEARQIELHWELPSSFSHRLSEKPATLIAHVLGDEGETSLLAQLKREGLASSLLAGDHQVGAHTPTFQICISLTPLGLQKKETVLKRCYQAIKNLSQTGIDRSFFQEVCQLSKQQYQNQELPKDAFDQASRDAHQMLDEPLKSYPEKSQIPQEYAPALVQEYLSYLTPQRSLTLLQASKEEMGITDGEDEEKVGKWKKEKWMGVPYAIQPLEPSLLEQLAAVEEHPKIQLPPANPYLPESFTLLHTQRENKPVALTPELLHHSNKGKVFFAPDQHFGSPKVSWKIQIKSPSIDPGHPKSQVLTDLLICHFNDLLESETYPAKRAGLTLKVSHNSEALQLQLHGYHHKAMELWKSCLQRCAHSFPSEEKFQSYLDRCRRSYSSAYKQAPYQEPLEQASYTLMESSCTEREKLQAEVSYEDGIAFMKELFQCTYTEGTLYGNMDRSSGEEVLRSLEESLLQGSTPFKKEEHYSNQAQSIPAGTHLSLSLQSSSQDHVGLLIHSHGKKTSERLATISLLNGIMATPYFEELRTKKQMGYIVHTAKKAYAQELATLFLVQSPSHSPEEIIEETRTFLHGFFKELKEHPEKYREKFESARSAAIQKGKLGPTRSLDMANQLHTLAFEDEENFHFPQELLESFEKMEYSRFLSEVEELFAPQHHGTLTITSQGGTSHS